MHSGRTESIKNARLISSIENGFILRRNRNAHESSMNTINRQTQHFRGACYLAVLQSRRRCYDARSERKNLQGIVPLRVMLLFSTSNSVHMLSSQNNVVQDITYSYFPSCCSFRLKRKNRVRYANLRYLVYHIQGWNSVLNGRQRIHYSLDKRTLVFMHILTICQRQLITQNDSIQPVWGQGPWPDRRP